MVWCHSLSVLDSCNRVQWLVIYKLYSHFFFVSCSSEIGGQRGLPFKAVHCPIVKDKRLRQHSIKETEKQRTEKEEAEGGGKRDWQWRQTYFYIKFMLSS